MPELQQGIDKYCKNILMEMSKKNLKKYFFSQKICTKPLAKKFELV